MLGSPEEIDQGLLTVREVAKMLHIGITTVYELMERGQIQYVKIGKARRIPLSVVRKFAVNHLKGGWSV